MNFIYILQLTAPYKIASNWTDETYVTFKAHSDYLKDLHQKGMVKMVSRTNYGLENDDNRGHCIFEAESPEKASEIMLNDPCVKDGVMTAELHPLLLFILGEKTFW